MFSFALWLKRLLCPRMSADGGGGGCRRPWRLSVLWQQQTQRCSRRETETSVMLKGNLKDFKLYLDADMQNTERSKTTASVLLLPNTDKTNTDKHCFLLVSTFQDVKSIVTDPPPPPSHPSLRISFILTLMRNPSWVGPGLTWWRPLPYLPDTASLRWHKVQEGSERRAARSAISFRAPQESEFIAALFAQEAGVNCWREVGGRFQSR